MTSLPLVVVSVGNTRTKIGIFRGIDLDAFESHMNVEHAAIVARITELASGGIPIAIASVNSPVADPIEAAIKGRTGGGEVFRIGRDIPVPIAIALDDASTVGQDRLLNALGAFSKTRQACIVIDCGTATTVDFVDGEGTFQGGAIAPGARMMVKALHANTAALPAIEYALPEESRGPLGKDTAHAMLLGATASIRGLVHYLIDRYAEYYEAYPTVIATGGDAPALFENDELVEKIVPSLQLIGIHEAFVAATRDEDAEEGGGEADDSID